MKKNYIQPIAKLHNVKFRALMQSISPTTPDFDDNDHNLGDGENYGKTIWNDETSDGFNW